MKTIGLSSGFLLSFCVIIFATPVKAELGADQAKSPKIADYFPLNFEGERTYLWDPTGRNFEVKKVVVGPDASGRGIWVQTTNYAVPNYPSTTRTLYKINDDFVAEIARIDSKGTEKPIHPIQYILKAPLTKDNEWTVSLGLEDRLTRKVLGMKTITHNGEQIEVLAVKQVTEWLDTKENKWKIDLTGIQYFRRGVGEVLVTDDKNKILLQLLP